MTEKQKIRLPDTKSPAMTVRSWADQMRPFAERHPNPLAQFRYEEKDFEESYNGTKTKVAFSNLCDFAMIADLEGGRYRGKDLPRNSGFVYGRSIAPYDNEKEWGLNMNFASRLVVPVIDWANSIGLGTMVMADHYRVAEVHAPAIVLRGELPAERFSDYLDLVGQVEYHIDSGLKLEDEKMERPYVYALIKAPEKDRNDLTVFKEVNEVNDLVDARVILKARYEINKSLFTKPYHRTPGNVRDEAEKLNGKLMDVDEFVRSKDER